MDSAFLPLLSFWRVGFLAGVHEADLAPHQYAGERRGSQTVSGHLGLHHNIPRPEQPQPP